MGPAAASRCAVSLSLALTSTLNTYSQTLLAKLHIGLAAAGPIGRLPDASAQILRIVRKDLARFRDHLILRLLAIARAAPASRRWKRCWIRPSLHLGMKPILCQLTSG